MALRVEDIDLAADRELVERWQAGEQSAFDDLYRRYFHRLRAHCYRRVGDRHVAEELAQEAFVKALQALPRFAGERRFYPWVSVIATRLCVDHHRRMGRVRPSDDIDPGVVDGDHGTRLAFLADVDNLDRAMKRLGPRHAEVLEMRERRGMSYAEIAEELHVPHSTVEALLFRARKALRREFMAVSGEGRLAGLPLVGWLVRRAAGARERIGDLMPSLSQLGGPVAAGAMAVVITASPFSGANATAPAVPTVAAAPLAAVSTSEASVDAPGPADTPVAPVAKPGAARSDIAAPTPVPGVQDVGSDEASRRAEGMPFLVDLGGAGLGVNPTEVAGWLDDEESP